MSISKKIPISTLIMTIPAAPKEICDGSLSLGVIPYSSASDVECRSGIERIEYFVLLCRLCLFCVHTITLLRYGRQGFISYIVLYTNDHFMLI